MATVKNNSKVWRTRTDVCKNCKFSTENIMNTKEQMGTNTLVCKKKTPRRILVKPLQTCNKFKNKKEEISW